MRVVLIEDEPLIALDVEQIVVEAGFEVAGMAATFEGALALVASAEFDAAVVDANLGGKSAGAIADVLKGRGIPFVAISGYSIDQRPAAFAGAPFLSKPFKPSALLAAIRSLKG